MSELVTDEILDKAIGQHWDLRADEARELFQKCGKVPTYWADVDPKRKADEKYRYTDLLRFVAPLIARQALGGEASLAAVLKEHHLVLWSSGSVECGAHDWERKREGADWERETSEVRSEYVKAHCDHVASVFFEKANLHKEGA